MKFKKLFEKRQEENETKTVDENSENSEEGDENKARGNWNRQIEFFLSCVSYAVGLGNIWRFPYLCMRNGGGAFLIPYFTFMLVIGMPLFYLELAMGQFSSLSVISVWNISPLFKGVGVATMIVTGVVCIYYNAIVGWILYYLFNSFQATLPWATCDNSWNTDRCFVRPSIYENENGTLTDLLNSTATPPIYEALQNSSSNSSLRLNTPAEEFWHYNVLGISSGIGDFGGMQWKLLGTLTLGCIINFVCLIKGIKTSGKVVYMTATVPYVFLTILLIRGLTLPGAIDGIKYFVVPDWKRLLEFRVWVEACLQIFYSVGPGWGSLITMASYNRFHNRIHIDSLLVPIINCLTSFFAGMVIFSIIGFMAKDVGLSVQEVVTSGPGLAFIAYPEALTKLPISPVWSIMFFVMLLNIGLGTQFVMIETISSGFIDQFPSLMKVFKKKWAFTLFVFIVIFFLSLPLITQAGIYYFQVVDWYSASVTVPLIAILECVVCTVIYGIRRFRYDIECMIGGKPNLFIISMWTCVTPLVIFVVLIVSVVDFPRPYYGDYTYPDWAIGFGWTVASISLSVMPIFAICLLWKAEGGILKRLRNLLRPADDWGPALAKHRVNYKYIKSSQVKEIIADKENTHRLINSETRCSADKMVDDESCI